MPQQVADYDIRPMNVRAAILEEQLREFLTLDLGPARTLLAGLLYAKAVALRAAGRPDAAFGLLMRIHDAAWSRSFERRIASQLRDANAAERRGRATGLSRLCGRVIHDAVTSFERSDSPDPERFIGSRLLVVKSPRGAERGVIVVDYSYVFPLFAGLIDLRAVADRYTLVLEPSWRGVCTPEILLYSSVNHPVFVQTLEPRDQAFLSAFASNLSPVSIAANWWVDHRSIRPLPGVQRDIDVISVASWSAVKRHSRLFRAVAQLRKRGHRLKVALVGYPQDRKKFDIEAQARHFGVADQIELHEQVSQDEVTRLLTRSKVHVLWSRMECANRAIIEAMLAGVPVIVRDGLTYGYKYPYINSETGMFVHEHGLADAILETIDRHAEYHPREWVLSHMTPHHAMAKLTDALRNASLIAGEPWTEEPVVKTSALNYQTYWNHTDRSRFEDDYRYLRSRMGRSD